MNDYFRHAIYTKKNPLVLYLQSDASDICDNIQFLLGPLRQQLENRFSIIELFCARIPQHMANFVA